MEKVTLVLSSIIEFTSRFVDVPISVLTPPRIPANESGIKSFEGLMFSFDAISIMMGINTMITAVLFINEDAKLIKISIINSQR